MKTAVVTMNIGDKFKEMAELTIPTMKAYADKINADFVIIDSVKIDEVHIHFEKFQIYDMFDIYDRILFLDMDLIVSPSCPNLFDIVPEEEFGAFVESDYQGRDNQIIPLQEKCGDIGWKETYFNSGVFLVSKKHKEMFNYNTELSRVKGTGEQGQLNYTLQKLGIPLFKLDLKFNHMDVCRKNDERFNSYIIHYAGGGFNENNMVEQIKEDLEKVR